MVLVLKDVIKFTGTIERCDVYTNTRPLVCNRFYGSWRGSINELEQKYVSRFDLNAFKLDE